VASQLLIVGAPEAARAELEALEVAWRHSRGEGHPAVARVAANLAIAEEDRGSLDRALELHLRALAGFQRALGPEHPLVIKATTNVGNCHLVRGEARDAIAWLEPAAVRLLDADPDHVLDTVATHLARAFAEVEAFEQALLWHHHAQTSARTQSKAAQAFAAAWQARTLVQAGHAEQALQEVIRARTELEAAGAPGGYLAIPRWIEAEALLALERHAEAVVALEEAFAHAPRGSLPLQLAELEFALGRALAPRDPQRAMTLVQSAVDAFDRVAPAHPRRDTIVTWRDHAWK
jgi:tetratricopeptide (TPR) repeat protein